MKQTRLLLLSLVAMLLVACGTTKTVPITGRKQNLMVSDGEMLSLSTQQYSEYMKTAKASTNAANTAMVQRVGQRLATAVESFLRNNGMAEDVQNYKWQFNLVQDQNVNAWCMPGGLICVYEGLLPVTQNEASLAIVLGHEIAHAVARHSAEQYSTQYRQQYGLQIGAVLASAVGVGDNAVAIGQDIIGALYAVGYDPDMIEKLVREQDWNQVLYDKFSEELMPIDRRMNERRYLATFPITNGKMKVKSAFVEGVYVNMLLSRLMLPAHNIQDYSKLSVPFYCIATDVEHACQYEMTSGSLSRSVRASMSIPFLFQPVTIDGRLLIDGGMVNNFPVRNMKEHGADIIIGIDLEDESIPASQIDNSLQLFTSLMNLSSLEESLYARSHCNIYIKPNLHGRDMLSFNDFDSIIQFGQDAADKFYPQFQRLADSLQNLGHFEINRPHVQPVEKIKIVGINVEGIPENHKHSFARLYATEFPATVTLDQIEELIVKLKISGYYDNLWYYISDAPDGYILNIHCDEVADKSMSAAIHYDNNYGIGALVNFTFNNVMKSIDRSTISLDVNIAENPYIKGHFNTQMGKYFRMGADLSFYSVDISQYDDNQMTNSYSIQDNNLDLYMQLIPTVKQQFRLGAVADYVHMKDFVGDNQLNSDYHFYSYLYLNYFYKNEDAPSFARRGWKIDITGKCVFFEGVNNEGVLTSNGWQNSIILHGNIIKSSSIGKKSLTL